MIALSAYADDVTRLKVKEAGFDDHVEKPMDAERLSMAVKSSLAARAGGRET